MGLRESCRGLAGAVKARHYRGAKVIEVDAFGRNLRPQIARVYAMRDARQAPEVESHKVIECCEIDTGKGLVPEDSLLHTWKACGHCDCLAARDDSAFD